MTVFSERHGFERPEPPIKYREDASSNLRDMVITLAEKHGLQPSVIRSILCEILFVSADVTNWSEYPNIDSECRYLIGDCPWYEVFDAIEIFTQRIRNFGTIIKAREFEQDINKLFVRDGAGWQIDNSTIIARGSESFNVTAKEAHNLLNANGNPTAASEIHEAIKDISRRPNPDKTGAVHHAMAAIECLTRSYAGASKQTLGEILKSKGRAHGIPAPIDEALAKLWGYSSERGRHVREGDEPSFDEAELIVTISSAICVYLSKKQP